MAASSSDSSKNISATILSTISPGDPNPNLIPSTTTTMANVTKPRTADGGDGLFSSFPVNEGVLMRVTFVFLGLTFILVLYFGIKFWRLRRRKTNIRRYDVLSTQRLATDIGLDSGSEDELFDDAQAKLVRNPSASANGGRNSAR